MKLQIQTLIGQMTEVEADPHNTILDLKKIIYKNMKITGAVRVIKGQEVLPDGSTLEQHGITDGSTVNIIIEPEKDINLQVKLGPKQNTCSVSNSLRVRELKQRLIDGGIVGFAPDDFTLLFSVADNDGITADVLLQDESLPLYMYGVNDNMTMRTIRIIGRKIRIQLVTNEGSDWYKSFPKSMTVEQLKKIIQSVDHFFPVVPKDKEIYNGPWSLMDIILFVRRGESYQKLDAEAPIGSVLSNNDVVHFIEDRFFEYMIPVYFNEMEIERVGWSTRESESHRYSDTVLSLKLRVQEELGFPVRCLSVTDGGYGLSNCVRIRKMKLRIQTLTGQSAEVEADPQDTILDLKKVIYKLMPICGAVRVIKGQEVLSDGSTLEQHGITDGSTVNIVIEPDKEVNVCVKLGPKEVKCSVRNSVRMRELKQHLIDGGTVGFMLSEFTLNISADDNEGITEDITLNDESLPLHLCAVGDNTTLNVIRWNLVIQVVNQRGQRSCKTFQRNMTVNRMKRELLSEDITLFLQTGSVYRKFDGDGPIGDVLSNNDIVYYIEDRFCDPPWVLRVYYEDLEIGRVECFHDDTVLSVKLRVQGHMGFPVPCLDVQCFDGHRLLSMKNSENIGNGSHWVNVL